MRPSSPRPRGRNLGKVAIAYVSYTCRTAECAECACNALPRKLGLLVSLCLLPCCLTDAGHARCSKEPHWAVFDYEISSHFVSSPWAAPMQVC